MKTSTGTPTKAERERLNRLSDIGCICCLLSFGDKNPIYEVHHIVQTKRLGHWYTLPLCVRHHRIRYQGGLWTSIADGSKAFQKYHGTELDLWLKVQHMLNLSDELPASKIVPRRVHGG